VWLCGPAWAEEVQAFKPAEAGVSAVQLRKAAEALAFEQAVLQAAQKLLPCDPGEQRREILRQLLAPDAGQFVREYTEISARAAPEGVTVQLEVEVDRQALRERLVRVGAVAGCGRTAAFSFRVGPGLAAADLKFVEGLMALAGLVRTGGALPELSLERAAGGSYRGTLRTAQDASSAADKDLRALWTALLGRHFAQEQAKAARSDTKTLRVSGWFAPDGLSDFDRVLRGWDAVVQDVQLLEMDIQPAGIVGRWRVRVMDAKALEVRLGEYLPGRGLSYAIADR
jgi:hypothetical protein